MIQKRKKEIEQLAMRILSQYRIMDNPGQHLQIILDGEQIQLLGYDDWAVDICGRFMYIEEEPVIFFNSKHTPAMQAFTIAHELGHYFLKHLENEEAEIICLNRDFQRMDDSSDAKKEREVEANYFAACLLLPLNLIYPVFETFMQSQRLTGILYVDKQQCNFIAYKRCIWAFQMHFTASETAIRFRLVSLGWMRFNIQFQETEDRGISIADYLRKYGQIIADS